MKSIINFFSQPSKELRCRSGGRSRGRAIDRAMRDCRGSIAFEYVVVTVVGVGMSLVVMQIARKTMHAKIEQMSHQLDDSFYQFDSARGDERGSDGVFGDGY